MYTHAATILACLLGAVTVLSFQPEPAWIPLTEDNIQTLFGILAVSGILVSIGHLKAALKKDDQ